MKCLSVASRTAAADSVLGRVCLCYTRAVNFCKQDIWKTNLCFFSKIYETLQAYVLP